MKKLRVTVDGKAYEVAVEVIDAGFPAAGQSAPSIPVASAAIAAPAPVAKPAAPAPAAGGSGTVPSPLAGKVVAVDVKPGQAVAAGAQLLTLEAMKMNTFVYAPKAGTVATVHVTPGDAVEEGGALVTIN